MNTTQYTIRNIPEPVDQYLRRLAKVSGRSLNQVVIDELSERSGLSGGDVVSSLDWFIGGGTADEVDDVLLADDEIQKQLTKNEWHQM